MMWANLIGTRLMLLRADRHTPLPLPELRPSASATEAAGGQQPAQGSAANTNTGPERFINVLFAPHLPRGRVPYYIDASGVHGR